MCMQFVYTFMEQMIMVRLSRARWDAVKALAEVERRSATVQLGMIVDRGMGGRAGYELAVLAEARAEKLMRGSNGSGR